MNDNDITITTPVRHTDSGEYSITAIEVTHIGPRISITKRAFGSVFTGLIESARVAGFMFGDEEAPDVSVEDIEALLTPEEPTPSATRQAWLACEEANRALTETIESREADIANLKEELSSVRSGASDFLSRAQRAEANLDSFKDQVRDQVQAAMKEHDLCIDGCNSFLEELGLPLLQKKYTVTVTRDNDGTTILTVTGIEADDEEAAKDEVRQNFSVTATVKSVHFDYEYDGEGEADFDESDYDDDDWDETDSDIADNHEDNLSFSVEED